MWFASERMRLHLLTANLPDTVNDQAFATLYKLTFVPLIAPCGDSAVATSFDKRLW